MRSSFMRNYLVWWTRLGRPTNSNSTPNIPWNSVIRAPLASISGAVSVQQTLLLHFIKGARSAGNFKPSNVLAFQIPQDVFEFGS